jgi:hypothetical protein
MVLLRTVVDGQTSACVIWTWIAGDQVGQLADDAEAAVGSSGPLWFRESDTWTRVLPATADCPSIGSDMIVGSSE